MLLPLILIYAFHCASACETETSIIPTCSDDPRSRMSLDAVQGLPGRYRAELCTAQNNTSEDWDLMVTYYKSRDICKNTSDIRSIGDSHSTNYECISKEHNCTANQTVCMSANFDLIFSACYAISSQFSEEGTTRVPSYFYFNITNPYTKEYFHTNHAIVDLIYNQDDMVITWHAGIPLMAYTMKICNATDLNSCEPVENCTRLDATSLRCRLAPPPGCYRVYLRHVAPWITGLYANQETVPYDFCREPWQAPTTAGGGGGGAWAWAGAALVLAVLAVLAARAALAALARSRLRRKVQATWRRDNNRGPEAGVGATGPRSVLVLYARECAAADRAVAAIVEALTELVDGEVYDLFSPAVTAACARAPAQWARGLLARADVAVLLLQTPALHALYSTHAEPGAGGPHTLAGGLLGRRLAAREPRFGDALLTLLLRQMAEAPRAPHHYRKYYIATLSALPCEVVPCVVPYARYALPAAADVLLRDVGARAPAARHVAAVRAALQDYQDYATDHPFYLMDELVCID